jgi:predicted N-acetyltransferase YhbS
VREVRPEDGPQISALHARAFGPGRFARTAYRIREGIGAFSRYCRVCLIDWAHHRRRPLHADPHRWRDGALLLGPLAVDPEFTNRGHGRGLVREAMDAARADGLGLVLLVGDEPYYRPARLRARACGQIALPGPVNPQRLLAAELRPGGLADYRGLVTAVAQA